MPSATTRGAFIPGGFKGRSSKRSNRKGRRG